MRDRVSALVMGKPEETADLAGTPLAKKFERQRGLSSFLAWIFVLGQIQTAKALAEAGSHADAPYDGVGAHPSDDQPKLDELTAAGPLKSAADVAPEDDAGSPHAVRNGDLLPLSDVSGTTFWLKAANGGASTDNGGGAGGGAGGGYSFWLAGSGLVAAADANTENDLGTTTGALGNIVSDAGAAAISLTGDLGVPHLELGIDLGLTQTPLDLGGLVELVGTTAGASLDANVQFGLAGISIGAASGDLSVSWLDGAVAASIGLQSFGEEASFAVRLSGPFGDGIGSNLVSETSQVAAEIVTELSELSGLSQTGDISSGGTITFPAQLSAPQDPLLGAGPYTEYQQVLQLQQQDVANSTSLVSNQIDHAEASPAAAEAPSDKPHEITPAPTVAEHVADPSLPHLSISLSLHPLTLP
jgi:hypothetical protein